MTDFKALRFHVGRCVDSNAEGHSFPCMPLCMGLRGESADADIVPRYSHTHVVDDVGWIIIRSGEKAWDEEYGYRGITVVHELAHLQSWDDNEDGSSSEAIHTLEWEQRARALGLPEEEIKRYRQRKTAQTQANTWTIRSDANGRPWGPQL